ncbi:MAG: glycosyltransferase family 2 protein [Xanthomonadales bacterium]|nr:glycosyltransferase family 2 protein [Xanthomonadales bacterium]
MATPLVVIPVFNARTHVQACLASVAEHSPDERILVIDDASTDAEVRPMLEAWVAEGRHRQLIVHETNKGFVSTANEGMRQADGHVVLLNSDTQVTPGWLERMARCLDSDPGIATATPWTNNGEIASFPRFCVANDMPDDPARLAELIGAGGQPEYPDIPTAVGFCMAISNAAIKRIGYFDEDAFGKGYGEENDFCLRAAAAGMRNVLCDDAFVAHHGGASFSPLGLRPDANTMRRLLDKHPGYQEVIEAFIRLDPLAPRREFLVAQVQAHGGATLESAERTKSGALP